MGKVLLLLVLGIVTMYYFPDSRQILLDAAEPLVLPVIKSRALGEMERVGRNVIEYERLTGEVPDRGSWLFWLDSRYSLDEQKRDPWGSGYELRVVTDSVMIISYGPDRVRATEDDFDFVTPRSR